MGSLFLSRFEYPRYLSSRISKDAAKLANSNKEKQTSPKKNANFIFEDVVVPMQGEQWENE